MPEAVDLNRARDSGAVAAESTLVAIDGGKSGLRVAVRSPGGTLSGHAAGTFYADDRSLEDAITSTVEQALAECGFGGRASAACAGLTGWPADAGQRDRLRDRLARVTGAARMILVEDCVTAHAGALGQAGTVVSAGTGTVVLALGAGPGPGVGPGAGTGASGGAGADAVARRDGWGPFLGDRGSGFQIGQAGLIAACRAVDGVGPATRLVERMREFLGGAGLERVQAFYAQPAPIAAVAGFAPHVFAAARARDEVAAGIVDHAAAALAATAIAAASAVAAGSEIPGTARLVSYTGRLFDAGDVLLEPFARTLRENGLEVHPPAGDALAGALRLAAAAAGEPDFGVYTAVIADMDGAA